jgi:uncharacterized protein (TIGR03435 family)
LRPYRPTPTIEGCKIQDQLGLKLETSKAPVEFLVIESVEEPSEN